jgi:TrpR-related protein YerC/YecD
MPSKVTDKDIKDLYQALLKLETPAECKKFIRDIATLKEIEALAERWKVVKMLDKDMSYRQIAEETGVSTTTITRVAHWLHHGEGGYRMMLDRIKKK